jgi:hypothetical protein
MKSYKVFVTEAVANRPNETLSSWFNKNVRAGRIAANRPIVPTSPAAAASPNIFQRVGNFGKGYRTSAIGAGLDYLQRKQEGQSNIRAAGGALSNLAGFAGGARIGAMVPGPPIVRAATTLAGGLVGGETASKAYDWAAEKSRPARQAISRATGYETSSNINKLAKQIRDKSGGKTDFNAATRQAQSTVASREARQQQAQQRSPGTITGSGVVGAGGKTTYSRTPQGAAFVSTGTGQQRRTAQLPSQMILPGNKIGDLAFKGGKPTYLARPSVEATKQNPLQRFARATNLLGYADKEKQQQQQNINRAKASTREYYGKLGISQQKQQQLNPSLGPAPKTKTGFSGKLK